EPAYPRQNARAGGRPLVRSHRGQPTGDPAGGGGAALVGWAVMGYRVAVIGGGQLARMMAGPAEALQVEVRALVEAPDSAAAQVLPGNRVGLPAGAGAVESLVEDADVLTFEHEHVSGDLLRELAARGVSVQPGPDALVAAQDKIVMRTLLGEAGVPVPRWRAATSAAEVRDFAAEAGWP